MCGGLDQDRLCALDRRKEVCVSFFIPPMRSWISLCLTSSSCAAALNPFGEQENVDAKFVEETALKQTLILLGLGEK